MEKIVNTIIKNNTYHTEKCMSALKKTREKLYKKVYYKNLETGNEIIFNFIKESAEISGMPRINVYSFLHNKNKKRNKYKNIIIKYYEDVNAKNNN